MKNLTLLIIFSVLTVGGYAQIYEADSCTYSTGGKKHIAKKSKDGGFYLGSLGAGQSMQVTMSFPTHVYADTMAIKPHYDTIPVLMLVSDTVHYISEERVPDGVGNDTCTNLRTIYFKVVKHDKGQYNFNVWRISGFEVIERNVLKVSYLDWEEVPNAIDHIAWLDSNKKPLKTSVIVWIKKEMK